MSDIEIQSIDAGQRPAWNRFVAQSPAFALMQSYEWGEFKEKLGWRAVRLAALREGQIVAAAQMLIKAAPLGLFSVGYVPRGPLVDWDDEAATGALLAALHREARRQRAVFLKIEPALRHSPLAQERLAHHGFRPSAYTNQPRATIVLDLTQDLDAILDQMRKKTRYAVRYAGRQGVSARIGDETDLAVLDRLMRITGRRAGFPPRAREYYEYLWQSLAPLGQVHLQIAEFGGEALAAEMSVQAGEHAASLHACSSDEHKEMRANYLLVWAAIKWAKARNCRTLDLWGIPDEVGQAVYEGRDLPQPDRTDGLWGVYRFKRGFCRNVVYYVQAHDYVYAPALYPLVTLLDAGWLDRIAVGMDRLKGGKSETD